MVLAFRVTPGLVEEIAELLAEQPGWSVRDAIAQVCGGRPANEAEIARAVAAAMAAGPRRIPAAARGA